MEIRIFKAQCKRCNHIWVPRRPKRYVCPLCHSAKWNEAEGNKSKMWNQQKHIGDV